jgi:N-dimethylarginine dimethylaminohydrolase
MINTVDTYPELVYTNDIVSMLQEIAIVLLLDKPALITINKYTPQTLDRMIRKKLSIRTGRPLTRDEIEKLYNERNNL